MINFSEKTKKFLLYGIDKKIEKKQIYKLDGAMLFVSILAMLMAEAASAPFFIKISFILFDIGFVIATFSKTDVTGEKVFWIYGMQGSGMSILFCWFGTALMLSTIGKEYYVLYIIILLIIYTMAALAYACLILTLIKTDKYAPASHKKVVGSWSVACFVMFGISAAKIMSAKMPYMSVIRITGLGCYLVSLLCLISIFNFVKYLVIRKYKLKPNDRVLHNDLYKIH